MNLQRLVVRDQHRLGGIAPAGALLLVDSEVVGAVGVALDGRGGGPQILLRHQVGVDVVVSNRAVLVRTGHAVDPEVPGRVVVAERAPQPRRLDQQLDADVVIEALVFAGHGVADHRVGDVGVDVKRRDAGRPVARAFLPGDRPPREGGALEPQ